MISKKENRPLAFTIAPCLYFGLLYSTLLSKFSPSTKSGMSSSSSSPFFSPSSFFMFWYDSANFRNEASESGPSWLRIPGTSSVNSFSSPFPVMQKVFDGTEACTVKSRIGSGYCSTIYVELFSVQHTSWVREMNNVSIFLEHVYLLDGLDSLHIELLQCCLELLVVRLG